MSRKNPRLYPRLTDPNYLHLSALTKALETVATKYRGTLIDYGCGSKPYAALFLNVQKYIGVDFSVDGPDDLILSKEGSVPCSDGAADIVLSTQVLEHVPDVGAYLAECARLAKRGGRLILTTHGIWPYHPGYANDDYYRWTIAGLRYEIEKSGFKVTAHHAVCGGFLCLLQQFLAIADPARLRRRRSAKYILRLLASVCINTLGMLLASCLPRLANWGDIVPICIVIEAEKAS